MGVISWNCEMPRGSSAIRGLRKKEPKIMSAAASTGPAQSRKIAKVKEQIGAIVTGIDLAQPIDATTRRELYDAVVENVVLVIRGQAHITPAQLQAAGEIFGELMEDQNRRYLVDGFPLISVLDNRHKDSKGQPAKVGTNATWHTDHTNQELPPKFTMLYAVAVPDKGGATSVCNARAGRGSEEAVFGLQMPRGNRRPVMAGFRFEGGSAARWPTSPGQAWQG
jgi:hypothetical protein